MAQRCLLAKREKWKQAVDNGQAFAELLTDLLKASDSSDDNYVPQTNQRTKSNESSSS